MSVDLNKPVTLWRCSECGAVRTVIGDCHQHHDQPVRTEAVQYVQVIDGGAAE